MDEVIQHERDRATLREAQATVNSLAGRVTVLERGVRKVVEDFHSLSRVHKRAVNVREIIAFLEELL